MVQFPIGGVTNLGEVWVDKLMTRIQWVQCPSCDKYIITLQEGMYANVSPASWVSSDEHVLWPVASQRAPVPSEVPPTIKNDYEEAALVAPLSAKASAALSRRGLQAVLVDAGHADPISSLAQQIDQVRPALPSTIADALDQVRLIGNFAAHVQKSVNTGTVIDVEPGEAEWNLDVLDMLFDNYYVKPAEVQRRKDALNKKLQEAGKKPI
jgi:hypothetical protein